MGVGMAHAFSRVGHRAFISAASAGPTWLNQARLCLVNPEHLDPGAPLPFPSPARPRRPCGEGLQPRLARVWGNPLSNSPGVSPEPRKTSRFHWWET